MEQINRVAIPEHHHHWKPASGEVAPREARSYVVTAGVAKRCASNPHFTVIVKPAGYAGKVPMMEVVFTPRIKPGIVRITADGVVS
ncbi:MAG: hypothetical protein M0P95_17970 [Sulfuritalea sp.]|jgi:hypothetical protein|nr:hypothetical protein [Sulfuritalea sp.]